MAINAVVEAAVVSSVTLIVNGWIQSFLASRRNKRAKLAEIYQELIASEEDLREAYFEDEPEPGSNPTPKGWQIEGKGFTRTDKAHLKKERYVHAARRMNTALAGLSLVGSKTLIDLCFKLENIAQKPRENKSRNKTMNDIVTKMRKELHTLHEGAPTTTYSWW